MTRFLCFALLFAIAAPLHAQEMPAAGQSLPRDPALLLRMREQITNELQQIQQMRGIISPNDTQLIESLDAQQAEWSKQLRDITQQMQAGTLHVLNDGEILPGKIDSVLGRSRIPAMPGGMPTREPDYPLPPDPRGGYGMPGMPVMPDNRFPSQAPGMMPNPQMPIIYPTQPPQDAFFGGGQNYQDRGETNYWGPRLPKELTEVKQSVESLKREIAELKDTIKVLETQIQLLNRNILLSERVKENGN